MLLVVCQEWWDISDCEERSSVRGHCDASDSPLQRSRGRQGLLVIEVTPLTPRPRPACGPCFVATPMYSVHLSFVNRILNPSLYSRWRQQGIVLCTDFLMQPVADPTGRHGSHAQTDLSLQHVGQAVHKEDVQHTFKRFGKHSIRASLWLDRRAATKVSSLSGVKFFNH